MTTKPHAHPHAHTHTRGHFRRLFEGLFAFIVWFPLFLGGAKIKAYRLLQHTHPAK